MLTQGKRMRACTCGGDLLRHGFYYYKRPEFTGVRYICRECRTTTTILEESSAIGGRGKLRFANTGRPTIQDARHA